MSKSFLERLRGHHERIDGELGHKAGDKEFRVHLDGYNQLPYLKGEVDESPRNEFFYFGEHDLFATRYRNWKVHFQLKDDWVAGATLKPTVPRPVNLRNDPFEQHMDAPSYPVYVGEKLWTVLPAAALLQAHMDIYKDFPPRQAPGDFNPGAIVAAVINSASGGVGK